jgi:H+/gluconate symporter-like permease
MSFIFGVIVGMLVALFGLSIYGYFYSQKTKKKVTKLLSNYKNDISVVKKEGDENDN